MSQNFKLSEKFLEEFMTKVPEWGPLGEFVYYRTYSRKLKDRNEEWWETVRRVVEGTFTIQKRHCQTSRLPWKNDKAQRSAQIMYEKIFTMKFLPPGRGLWMMGTDFVYERGGMSLNNCAFVSTEDIEFRGIRPFLFVMDALMNGVGVGFDTEGADKTEVKHPTLLENKHVIPDSREGWVDSLGVVLSAFLENGGLPIFDYSEIRKYGEPIRGFGGVASGHAPLKTLHNMLTVFFTERIGKMLSSSDIVDIMNMIGKCVVAGNVRRSAEIAIGHPDDKAYVTMKDPIFEKELNGWRWASNNSVFATVGMDYTGVVESIAKNGEPGLVWLDNMQQYGRFRDNGEGRKDLLVKGTNPCIVGDTMIETTEGSVRVDEMLTGDWNVYTMDSEGKLAISHVHDVFLTKKVNILCDVTLSNGTVITCTPDHRFIVVLSDGSFAEIEAQNLNIDHIPICFQRIKKSEKYLRVKLTTQTAYVSEHRFVAGAYEDIDGKDVHHRDGVTFHNHWHNLQVLSHEEHSIHSNLTHKDWRDRDQETGLYLKKEYQKKKQSIAIPDEYLTKNGYTGKPKFVSVNIYEVDSVPVYDIAVIGNHNFIANNTVIHNCGEQALESFELCTLVETFPSRHKDYAEYQNTLKYAYMYAKTVTLVPTHWEESNQVLMKNRRIGTSQSGIIDSFVKHGRRNMLQWCDLGYKYLQKLDEVYSDWFCVPRSIKITSVKPSGTVSNLPGVSPGIHYPHAEYYIRRVRVASLSPLVPIMKKAGYHIYDDLNQIDTKIIDFPVHETNFSKRKEDVSVWEQMVNAVDYQAYWSDNNVSITVSFKPEEQKELIPVLEAFEDRLKAISFLPLSDHGYAQAPYEEIDMETYIDMHKPLKAPDFSSLLLAPEGSKFCDGDSCEI